MRRPAPQCWYPKHRFQEFLLQLQVLALSFLHKWHTIHSNSSFTSLNTAFLIQFLNTDVQTKMQCGEIILYKVFAPYLNEDEAKLQNMKRPVAAEVCNLRRIVPEIRTLYLTPQKFSILLFYVKTETKSAIETS